MTREADFGKVRNWELIDVEKRNRDHATFAIPPESVRKTLRAGDFAKLIFEQAELFEEIFGERMWVVVTNSLGGGRYVGLVDNHPMMVTDVQHGDVVEFEAKHICEVHKS